MLVGFGVIGVDRQHQVQVQRLAGPKIDDLRNRDKAGRGDEQRIDSAAQGDFEFSGGIKVHLLVELCTVIGMNENECPGSDGTAVFVGDLGVKGAGRRGCRLSGDEARSEQG